MALRRPWQHLEERFPGLGGGIALRVTIAALRRFHEWPPPSGWRDAGIPTLEQLYAMTDAELLAVREMGKRKLARWRLWRDAHPLTPDPDWLMEE